mmetsp:Transcript_26114/g.39516  ORF Transcript_26114/g.39516 Transcript_26114/m.39516 type:complete len:405 (-) Transcript_26114:44-1258(-)
MKKGPLLACQPSSSTKACRFLSPLADMNSNGWEGYGGPVRLDKYHLDGIDPSLDDCCRREVESNRVYNALTSTLSRHDVTVLAERRRRHVLHNLKFGSGCRCTYDPNSDGGDYRALIELREIMKKEQEEADEDEEEEPDHEEEDDKDDSDDEFDYLLDEDLPIDNDLEERRRAELEFSMLHQEMATLHGFGVHRQMHPCRVLKAAGLESRGRSPPDAVVLHLFDPESMKSASLDLILEDLAKTCKGTKFLRSDGRSTLLLNADVASSALPNIKLEEDLPCLVCIDGGTVVSTSPRLQGLTEEDRTLPSALRNWLDRSHVLVESTPPFDQLCSIRPEEDALLDHMRAPKEPELERFDCGVPNCNKTFFHEHVGIGNEQQKGLVVSEEAVLGTPDAEAANLNSEVE